jgi:putative ABC transport system permease protein
MRSLVALRLLLHDRSSTAGSVLGVIAIVFLVGQQLAVLFGMLGYMSLLPDNAGADIWVVSKNTNNINTSGNLPMRYVERIRGVDDVEWVEPLLSSTALFRNTDGKFQAVNLIGLPTPSLRGGPWSFAEGSLGNLLDDDGITVDSSDLTTLGNPRMGDIYEINNVRVKIVGITQNIRGFSGTLVFTNMAKARQISRMSGDRTSFILIKLKPGVDLDAGIATLRSILPDAEVFSAAQLSANTRTYYIAQTGIGTSFALTVFISILVGIIIIMLTMYTNVVDRQKDFAVLRALGGRKRDIRVIVLVQALIISIIGIFAGFTLLSLFLNFTRGSRLPAAMFPWVPPVHIAATILLCILGSLVAMRKAVKIEPASAFR